MMRRGTLSTFRGASSHYDKTNRPPVEAGQVRRFKNFSYDMKYVVLSFSKAKPCRVLMLDGHHHINIVAGEIYEYDHDTLLIEMSTECEP